MMFHSDQPTNFRLLKFCSDFMFNAKTAAVVHAYKTELESISPIEAIKVFTWMAQSDYDIQTISNKIDKLTSIFFNPLRSNYRQPHSDHFVNSYLHENRVLLGRMREMRPLFVKVLKSHDASLLSGVRFSEALQSHVNHFRFLETCIFPLFDKVLPQYGAYLRLESMFHSGFKQLLRELEYFSVNNYLDYEGFNRTVGRLYFRLTLRLYRENFILFPLCCQFIHNRFFDLEFANEHS